MASPLVLKNGLVQQEQQGEVGLYPYLGISNGQLNTGGSYQIQCVDGQLKRVFIGGGGGVIWDNGASIWDGGLTTWVS